VSVREFKSGLVVSAKTERSRRKTGTAQAVRFAIIGRKPITPTINDRDTRAYSPKKPTFGLALSAGQKWSLEDFFSLFFLNSNVS